MKKSIQKQMNQLAGEALTCQEMAAFFWASKKTSDEDKYYLYNHLSSFENILNQKNNYSNTQAELAVIHLRLRIDAVQMYAESHPDLAREYAYSLNKRRPYAEWLRCYMSPDARVELRVVRKKKATRQKNHLKAKETQRVRE